LARMTLWMCCRRSPADKASKAESVVEPAETTVSEKMSYPR
jgi:hypothetical protein